VRIVFVLAGLGAGGAEKVVNLLAHHRDRCGDKVHVIAVNATDHRSFFPYADSIEVDALPQAPRLLKVGATAFRLVELNRRLAAIKPDLIISFLTKVNVITGLAAMGLNAPTIMSERNNFKAQSMSPFWRWMAPRTARRATGLVMQTADARNSLPPHLQERAAVIPNPVVVPAVGKRQYDGQRTRFVAVGRLDKQKGFDMLLTAFAAVAQKMPEASLVIHGEGPERNVLEQQASALGIAHRVELPGVTKSPGDWVSPGDVFVLSSRFEGFPNVLLEALMGGMATVAFDCPWGPGEILEHGETGILVPEQNLDALSAAMIRVATDPALKQRLVFSGQASVKRYSAPVIAAQWDAVIANAVGSRPIGVTVRA
jgi:glycosyltransferase involved in cell wall biosynthesis